MVPEFAKGATKSPGEFLDIGSTQVCGKGGVEFLVPTKR